MAIAVFRNPILPVAAPSPRPAVAAIRSHAFPHRPRPAAVLAAAEAGQAAAALRAVPAAEAAPAVVEVAAARGAVVLRAVATRRAIRTANSLSFLGKSRHQRTGFCDGDFHPLACTATPFATSGYIFQLHGTQSGVPLWKLRRIPDVSRP